MKVKQETVILKGLLIFLVIFSFSFFWPSSPVYAENEKIGVLFISVGEGETYNADWIYQFFNNMFDVFPPGFFAGGPLEGGTCYTLVHYANEAEASICGVDQGTPIDQFCQEYTGSYVPHTLMDDWSSFAMNCFTPVAPIMYVLTFSIDPETGETIYNFHIDDPAGSGIGIADFTEMNNLTRMDFYYRLPGHKLPYREQLFKLWYGNDAPGYSPDTPELPNVKDALEEQSPEYEFILRHGWESYMENVDAYGDPTLTPIPESAETAISELIDAGVKRIVVVHTYASFSNLTQFGHEWYDSSGQGVSALPNKTFKECVEDINDGKGPSTQADLNAYLANKPWDTHKNHPFPLIKQLVENINSTVEVRFANPYGRYPQFEQTVLDMLNYTIAKYSIPSTASLKVILLSHGYVGSYMNAQDCDSYFKLADDLKSRLLAKVQYNFTWQGKFEVVAVPGEFAEGTDDPAISGKPFGNVMSVGEQIDSSINGRYVNELGQVVDNGTNNFDYIVVIPYNFESETSDTVYGIREEVLANNNYSSIYGVYQRDTVDQDGTKFDAGDLDAEYFTVKDYDASGWPGVPGCFEDPDCMTNNAPVNKGSASNPTTVIVCGTILSLNINLPYPYAARQGLTDALVKSIEQALQEPEPTLITLASFDAIPGNRSVTLSWVTASEVDNAGFNLYRSEKENGEYLKINGVLIPAEGSSTQGAAYEFVDSGLKNGVRYSYILEDIDTKGKAEKHGPQSATPRLIYAPLSR